MPRIPSVFRTRGAALKKSTAEIGADFRRLENSNLAEDPITYAFTQNGEIVIMRGRYTRVSSAFYCFYLLVLQSCSDVPPVKEKPATTINTIRW